MLIFEAEHARLEYLDLSDPCFAGLIQKCRPCTRTLCYGAEAAWALYDAIIYIVCNDIPGDIVECGVWSGGSMLLAALTLMHLGDTSRYIYLIFVEGMVEETLPARRPERISLLRLDTDVYRSTYHELVHLYPALSVGGVLIIDDYGVFEGSRLATDMYLGENQVPLFQSRINASVRLAIKPAAAA